MKEFSTKEKALIRELQEDLPLTSQPYKDIGKRVGFSEKEVLAKIQEWQKKGIIRRLGALVNHYQLGIQANAMVVWQVPQKKVKEVAEIMISFPEVSHCYERRVDSRWRYNLFTMIHGKTRADCKKVIREIAQKTRLATYELLFSSKEFKKESPKYFL